MTSVPTAGFVLLGRAQVGTQTINLPSSLHGSAWLYNND